VPRSRSARVGTDAIFACPALTVDESLSKYVPTYAYEFNDQNAPERYLQPVGFPYDAAHESEVQYLFSLQDTPFPGVLTGPRQQLAAAMKQYWTNRRSPNRRSSSRRPRTSQRCSPPTTIAAKLVRSRCVHQGTGMQALHGHKTRPVSLPRSL
jgi:carboxylesterase type B